MMAAMKLSDGISALLGDCAEFKAANDDAVFEIDGPVARRLHLILTTLHGIAVDMEVELSCLRDMEAGREIERTVESGAVDALAVLIEEQGGKILRPDFGRRK